MGNIFKSDEVYKHLKYDLHDRNEIVPVRGVYITGVYSPPFYNEPTLVIDQISTSPAQIDDFIETNRRDTDAFMRIKSFGVVLQTPTITNYTSIQKSQTDSFMRIMDFGLTLGSPTITEYQRTTKNCADSFMRITNFNCILGDSLSLTMYSVEKNQSSPEPILRISGISSIAATINDVIS